LTEEKKTIVFSFRIERKMVDEARKVCFEQLRHRNACSIDELKSKLRKVLLKSLFFLAQVSLLVANLNLQAHTHSRTHVCGNELSND